MWQKSLLLKLGYVLSRVLLREGCVVSVLHRENYGTVIKKESFSLPAT